MAPKSHYPAVLSVFFGLVLALAAVLGPATAQANTCAQSSYALNTQNAVDVLGSTGCTSVLGDLTITGSGITSLATLSNITSIGGDLNITSNANLGTLDGLDGLTSVTGAVTVDSNASLNGICDLENVTTIGGDLVVASNAGLQNAECPWSLQSVGGNIRFEDNPSIWTLSYLGRLTTHSGSITIHNSMHQLYFGADAPFALTEIGGDLVIEENGITGLDELINLTSVGGSLTISGNSSLDDVDGLSNLESVGGNLTVQSNATLGACLGFVPLLGYPNGPDSVAGSVTFASNQSGCNSVADIFAGVQPPGQPTITGITAGDSQITLTASVTEPGTFAITGYRGVCTDNQNNSFMSAGTGSSVTVTGLTNGTAYTCTVVALSDGGESQASGESIPKTPEERPEVDPAVLWLVIKGSSYDEEESQPGLPGAPGRPLVTAGSGSAALSWTAPTDNGGTPITGYQIQLAVSGSLSFTTVVANTNSTSTSYTVSGLNDGRAYVFRVAAINSLGQGPNGGLSDPVTPHSGSTGGGGYASACSNLPTVVDCRKLFAGDLATGGSALSVDIINDKVLSIPFMRETGTVPVAIRYVSFELQNNYFFDAWLSLTANGDILPGGNCSSSQPSAESRLFLKAQSGAGTGCTLPPGDGLVWLNFKFWNPYTGDLGSYSIATLSIVTY